jgi:hypothetical protein
MKKYLLFYNILALRNSMWMFVRLHLLGCTSWRVDDLDINLANLEVVPLRETFVKAPLHVLLIVYTVHIFSLAPTYPREETMIDGMDRLT